MLVDYYLDATDHYLVSFLEWELLEDESRPPVQLPAC